MVKKNNLNFINWFSCVLVFLICFVGNAVAMHDEFTVQSELNEFTVAQNRESKLVGKVEETEKTKALRFLFELDDYGKEIFRKDLDKDISCAQFSNNGEFLIIKYKGEAREGELINVKNGRKIGCSFFNFSGCKFSKNNKFVTIGHFDNTTEIIRTENGQIIGTFYGVSYWQISVDERFLLIVYMYKSTDDLVDIEDGKKVVKHFYHISWAEFSNNGKFLFIRYTDDKGEILETKNWKRVGKKFSSIDVAEFINNGEFYL